MIITYSKTPIGVRYTRNNGVFDMERIFKIRQGLQSTDIPADVEASDDFKSFLANGHFERTGDEQQSIKTVLVFTS